MDKVNKIHVDAQYPFKLLKTADLHRMCKENRNRIVKGWYRQAVQSGVVFEGNSRKQSQVNIEGSLKLLEQFKLNLDGAYYERFLAELEKLTKQSLDQQFTCSWELIEIAITNATGKDADIKITEDYFAN